MNLTNTVLDACRSLARAGMRRVAIILNNVSGGHITANAVTLTSLLGHVLVAYLIATRHPIWAGTLLIIFGLMDTLDGELARLQKKASSAGMLLDASTDRVKEVLLFVGAAAFYVELGYPHIAIWAVAACGSSLLVPFIKAKGETAVKDTNLTPNEINRLFGGGIASYEVRVSLFIAGLFTSLLPEMLVIITVLSSFTAASRLISISRKL